MEIEKLKEVLKEIASYKATRTATKQVAIDLLKKVDTLDKNLVERIKEIK